MSELTARRESWFDYLPGNWQQAVNTSPVLNALGRAFNKPSPNLERGIDYDQYGSVSDRNWLLQQAAGGPPKLNPLAAEMLDKGGTLAMFLGPAAKTADLKALVRAQTRTASGVPREQVWKEDGWFQGPDGKWRFEIDDSAFRYAGGIGRLGDVAPHPVMTAAYPDTTRIAVGALPADGIKTGSYTPRRDGPLTLWDRVTGRAPAAIAVGPATPRTSILHEMQHAVDDIEGAIPRSRNPYGTSAPADVEALARSKEYVDAPFEMMARATEHRANMNALQRAERPPWLDYNSAAPMPSPQTPAPWAKRPNGMDVLPERTQMEQAVSDLWKKPPDRYSQAYIDGFKGGKVIDDPALHESAIRSVRDMAQKYPNSEWSRLRDAMDAYKSKADRLGHNGGPPTTEWDDPFVYSLRPR